MIRHIIFTLDCSIPTRNTARIFFDRMHAWTFLFTAKPGLDNPSPDTGDFLGEALIAKRSVMPRDFDNLQSFELHVTMSRQWSDSFVWDAYSGIGTEVADIQECFCGSCTSIVEVLRCGTIGFKAKKVAVIPRVTNCKTGDCNTQIRAAFEDILSAAMLPLTTSPTTE